MATGNVDYNAVLADLEARKNQIDAAIGAVKSILASAGVITNGSGSEGVIRPENIPSHAFLSLSIGDATKKFFEMVKSKQTLPQIMQALERGGLPPAKYNTVYAVLRRRENQVGDIVRMGDEWGLTEWYPNNPNIRRRTKQGKGESGSNETAAQVKASSKKKKKPGHQPKGGITLTDGSVKILKEAGEPLHLRDIVERLAAMGRETTEISLRDMLLRKDKQKRFKLLGKGMIGLVGFEDSPLGEYVKSVGASQEK